MGLRLEGRPMVNGKWLSWLVSVLEEARLEKERNLEKKHVDGY